MTYDLTPSSFWRFPSLRPITGWDDDDDMTVTTPSGLSISEDDTHVYVETALPGIDPKDVEITFDKGMLWVKGETKEEEKKKKYYRKATSSFSYRVAIPGDIDPNKEPVATAKHGIMTIAFAKSPVSSPKKISVKTV
jgi:HSP20 family protein